MTKKLVLLLVGVCASFPLLGQKAPVQSAITYRVKPDRIIEFMEVRRQVVDIYKKVGFEETQLVYSSLSGPYEFVFVRNLAKWEDLDVPVIRNPKLKDSLVQLTALNSRMNNCLESMSRDLGMVSDLSYGMNEEAAPMMRVLRTKLKLGGVAEFMNLLKNEVVPGYKKAGIKTFVLITPRFGSGDLYSVIPRTWQEIADVDPLEKALGKEGYVALRKKTDALIEQRSIDLYSFRPGMSYKPAAAGATSGAN